VWVDALCSALNQNSAAWRQSPAATVVEARVVRWLCDLVGLADGASGTLTSGGSEANMIALKCARDRVASAAPVRGLARSPATLRVYASEQSHFSLGKAMDILGMGRENLRLIDTDERFRVRVDALRDAMDEDRSAGHLGCCVVGVAGATSTGAIDPLDELADVAQEYGVWFHVDAAYGGALSFVPEERVALRGIERAQSVTLDPHKWMFVPFACAAVLVDEGSGVLRAAFDSVPAYLNERRADDVGDDGALDFFRYGQLGTRRANALKLWATLRTLGRDGYRRIIERQLALTRHLAAELAAVGDFEVVGEVQTAVCCARYLPDVVRSAPLEIQDEVQSDVQRRVERSGRAWIATTVLRGRRVLRINVNGGLTRRSHVDELVALLREHGAAAGADLEHAAGSRPAGSVR
jgi:aromatic-L-amino-acid decarboxylase